MIDLGKIVVIEPDEEIIETDFIFEDKDLLLIRQLLAVVAMCPDAYDLGERLEDVFGELDDDQINRFAIGPDGCGEPAVIPSKGE